MAELADEEAAAHELAQRIATLIAENGNIHDVAGTVLALSRVLAYLLAAAAHARGDSDMTVVETVWQPIFDDITTSAFKWLKQKRAEEGTVAQQTRDGYKLPDWVM